MPEHADAFGPIIRLNGVDVGIAACKSPGTLSQIWQGFASFPRGFAAGVLQITALTGALGAGNKRHAQLRQQQLTIILNQAITHPDLVQKILSWLVHNQLSDTLISTSSRLAGGWFTMYALRMTRLARRYKFLAGFSNAIIAAFGTAILLIDKGDRELSLVLGAIITGRGDFQLCVPVEVLKNDLEMMTQSNDPRVKELAEIVRKVADLASLLNREVE